MNTTLPGYEIVFVETLPKKPKPKESFSWMLQLPAEGFPSKDLLKSQEFIPPEVVPLSHSTQRGPAEQFAEECNACLLGEGALAELAGEESPLPQAALEDKPEEKEEVQAKVNKAPPFSFHAHAKPKPRVQRVAPEFVSKAREYSGPLLGEVRCFHGMSLGELADVTRVAQHHLQNIEREAYDSLPALVYLRGYLKSVARELGLDMQQVSQSYLDRMQQARPASS